MMQTNTESRNVVPHANALAVAARRNLTLYGKPSLSTFGKNVTLRFYFAPKPGKTQDRILSNLPGELLENLGNAIGGKAKIRFDMPTASRVPHVVVLIVSIQKRKEGNVVPLLRLRRIERAITATVPNREEYLDRLHAHLARRYTSRPMPKPFWEE